MVFVRTQAKPGRRSLHNSGAIYVPGAVPGMVPGAPEIAGRRTVFFRCYRFLPLLAALLLTCIAAAKTVPLQGGRYDRQILVEIQKIISTHSEFKDVRADVEDGIVSLTGTVHLESARVWIEGRASGIPHVQGVRNSVVLDPPTVPDHELAQRVQARLLDAGFEQIRFTAHNGKVALEGVVRNQEEWRRVLRTVRSTPGVRETESKITMADD